MIYCARCARKNFLQGGDKSVIGGDSKILEWGGTGLHGRGQPLDGVGVPPSPHIGQPWIKKNCAPWLARGDVYHMGGWTFISCTVIYHLQLQKQVAQINY